MKRIWMTLFSLLIFIPSFLFLCPSLHAAPLVVLDDNIPNLTDNVLYTVPAGKKLVLGDLILSNIGDQPNCCIRVGRSTTKYFLWVAVPAFSTFSHTFKNVVLSAGQSLVVRNGASSGRITATLTGNLVNQ